MIVDRWIVKGSIEAISPIMIRNGRLHLTEIEDDPGIALIEQDAEGRAVITGSALKGILRARLAQVCGLDSQQRVEALFGHLPKRKEKNDPRESGGAGRAEFRNAFGSGHLAPVTKPKATRSATRIHRGTGAAKDGSLHTQQIVEEGTCFSVAIVLDQAEEKDAAFLIAALRLIDGSVDSVIGGGAHQGFGRIRWKTETEHVSRLDAKVIAKWIAGESTDWEKHALAVKTADGAFSQAIAGFEGRIDPSTSLTLPLKVAFSGFFLVSASPLKEKLKTEQDTGTQRKQADRTPLVAGYKSMGELKIPILPGTSFKGALRSQAERIWRTLSGDTNSKSIDVIDELFGSTSRAARLHISDFTGTAVDPVRHELVAIDRFTGGAADGAKFSHDVFEKPVLSGSITLRISQRFEPELTGKQLEDTRPEALSPQALGLLALVLRDLAEGDIPLGFGRRKGYGAVSAVNGESGAGPVDLLARARYPEAADARVELLKDVAAFREKTRRPQTGDGPLPAAIHVEA